MFRNFQASESHVNRWIYPDSFNPLQILNENLEKLFNCQNDVTDEIREGKKLFLNTNYRYYRLCEERKSLIAFRNFILEHHESARRCNIDVRLITNKITCKLMPDSRSKEFSLFCPPQTLLTEISRSTKEITNGETNQISFEHKKLKHLTKIDLAPYRYKIHKEQATIAMDKGLRRLSFLSKQLTKNSDRKRAIFLSIFNVATSHLTQKHKNFTTKDVHEVRQVLEDHLYRRRLG